MYSRFHVDSKSCHRDDHSQPSNVLPLDVGLTFFHALLTSASLMTTDQWSLADDHLIGPSKRRDVQNHFFTQIMVQPIQLGLVEAAGSLLIELLK